MNELDARAGQLRQAAEAEQLLTVAMPKGRIFSEATALLRRAGMPLPADLSDDSRKLIVPVPTANVSLILAKPTDIPTYVEYGAADIGIVGKDVLLEEARDVYELLDLGIGRCHLAVATLPQQESRPFARVATKYPLTATRYFRAKGQQVEVVKLNGSVELAPMIGLAERIVDIVSTGRTLRENGLVETETVCTVTSRLIANRVSYGMKYEVIDALCRQLSRVVQLAEDSVLGEGSVLGDVREGNVR
ncbi:ATP phosphoribosyltransferase [Numidum massiliense]|uniref:ATP phosphoribosyltransferase n=1 Tax=Numidum massiliense TaxID=1522315 RepID=UPI0006D570C8|nr:ATP phosphoribosyltransferase [Numidum massiliense]